MTTRPPLPPIAITMGDPAGIGPELIAPLWQSLRQSGPGFIWLGDPRLLPANVPHEIVASPDAALSCFASRLPVMPVRLQESAEAGRPDPRHAPAIIASIERATHLTREGKVAAIVTSPISKHVLKDAGFNFPGHTEYLAHLCDEPGAEVMMLVSPHLRVVPVTIHVSLRDAIAQLNTPLIVKIGTTLITSLQRDFNIRTPRIAVAGLNPHAGEAGYMGDEEARIIAPAITALRHLNAEISDPLPPDTMFTPQMRETYDAALCMYHDQALIPLKTLDMTHGVNVTLGLPIVRTSPDHGTAFDIAGRGMANESSMLEAVRLAHKLAAHRRRA
ncbi:4-hydroxythreonine-4-phosphate dehydrogenase PdxA [Candidatus Kirkpatrickella diaphorinae]|uniref:4-hydroxythreonine-4-phosphate dehydrogenase n=1 Tax=Candidatus Kirkpatrickella diaphorinae TaxID=2984322 RepID=A0ABY6GKD4_9PROT|nr:4-hydroxythreonine-4-phosphate dehydrogenase PdxA [Candidatus Kirkpatrickella diaphorinae]UYH51280.1 4-hydroxythreonine-4-phosphate dehydrogenase PdxA [Candidatus Kirkpatrickella diaphorinae]